MIVRLTGTLIELTDDAVVLERDGLAYEVLVPRYALGELAAHRGTDVTLHTVQFYEASQASGHLTPRLLGFLHPEDKRFFSRFVSVKGIGPRKALKALAEPVRRIATWIANADTRMLARLPGIGKKAADMIVASLKDQMEGLAGAETSAGAWQAAPAGFSAAQRDALEVLVAWGDARVDAQRWLERAIQLHPDLDSPDELVRAAYRVKTGVEG
ncbi:MAG TPA: helix-hairpin-helix domain-containing protein [Phycisphaerae bacterium]|nr:helix-hairpin-helix domain-containing protein [Phycisphaerae bacterium]HNU46585.1 helix-hairpin-helix domain-containing protein [Phycisphaerae bacterium]